MLKFQRVAQIRVDAGMVVDGVKVASDRAIDSVAQVVGQEEADSGEMAVILLLDSVLLAHHMAVKIRVDSVHEAEIISVEIQIQAMVVVVVVVVEIVASEIEMLDQDSVAIRQVVEISAVMVQAMVDSVQDLHAAVFKSI